MVPISIHSIIPPMLYGTHTMELLCGHAMEEDKHVCHSIRSKSKSSSVCLLPGKRLPELHVSSSTQFSM